MKLHTLSIQISYKKSVLIPLWHSSNKHHQQQRNKIDQFSKNTANSLSIYTAE